MNWDTVYAVSSNIVIRPQAYDFFVVTHSISSRLHTELDSGALRGLSFFRNPCTPKEAFNVLGKELQVSEQEFEAALDEMINNQLLVPHDKSLATVPDWQPEASGFGRLQSQHKMLFDLVRVLSYRSAIFQHVNGKNVLEVGCGTGILSIFSAQAGAKKVTAIEESRAILTAQQMAKANDCQDTISFLAGNSLDIEIDQPADVIVHELIGKDPFHENILMYIDDARRRFLKPGGRLIPYRMDVYCYGVQSGTWQDPQRLIAEAAEFQKAYGVDFSAYLAMLSNNQTPDLRIVDDLSADVETILSAETLLYEVDFYSNLQDISATTASAALNIQRRGKLNGILVFFRAHLDESIQLSNSPYAPHTHWGWSLHDLAAEYQVEPGDKINLQARITTVDGRERLLITPADQEN